jgi:hypothetical protein
LLAYKFARNTLQKAVQDYTETQPAALERVTLPPEQLRALQERLQAFRTALESPTNTQELALTGVELNALIGENKDFRDKVSVNVEGDRITGKISLPLQDLGPLRLQGRYLNGQAAFRVNFNTGQLNVALDTLQVNGKAVPAPFMDRLRQQNLAQELTRRPDATQWLGRLEAIQIQDGKVILRSKTTAR